MDGRSNGSVERAQGAGTRGGVSAPDRLLRGPLMGFGATRSWYTFMEDADDTYDLSNLLASSKRFLEGSGLVTVQERHGPRSRAFSAQVEEGSLLLAHGGSHSGARMGIYTGGLGASTRRPLSQGLGDAWMEFAREKVVMGSRFRQQHGELATIRGLSPASWLLASQLAFWDPLFRPTLGGKAC